MSIKEDGKRGAVMAETPGKYDPNASRGSALLAFAAVLGVVAVLVTKFVLHLW